MKKQLVLTLAIALFAFTTVAQNFEAPKKGAKLYVENTVIEVGSNDEVSFDLWLVKSKVARKAKFDTPKIIGADGVEFTVNPDAQNPGHYTVTLKTSELEAGNYSATMMGKRSGIHAVTGAILTLNVSAGKSVASKDGE